MKLFHRMESSTCVISIIGNLALTETTEFQEYVQPLIKEDFVKHLLLNCEKINIIDSRGVGLLAAILKDLEDLGKGFSICALNKANYSIMESLQLHQIISIYQLEIDALNAVKNNNK